MRHMFGSSRLTTRKEGWGSYIDLMQQIAGAPPDADGFSHTSPMSPLTAASIPARHATRADRGSAESGERTEELTKEDELRFFLSDAWLSADIDDDELRDDIAQQAQVYHVGVNWKSEGEMTPASMHGMAVASIACALTISPDELQIEAHTIEWEILKTSSFASTEMVACSKEEILKDTLHCVVQWWSKYVLPGRISSALVSETSYMETITAAVSSRFLRSSWKILLQTKQSKRLRSSAVQGKKVVRSAEEDAMDAVKGLKGYSLRLLYEHCCERFPSVEKIAQSEFLTCMRKLLPSVVYSDKVHGRSIRKPSQMPFLVAPLIPDENERERAHSEDILILLPRCNDLQDMFASSFAARNVGWDSSSHEFEWLDEMTK
mmetsp:Transcript_45187/g.116918  ORF Transcript_45187/g.116918 Transcript_45187/m.116918 type:complete len:377 (+) Transcript_45187:1120-2250(+)